MSSFYHTELTDDDSDTVLIHYVSTSKPDDETIADLYESYCEGIDLDEQVERAATGEFDRDAQ